MGDTPKVISIQIHFVVIQRVHSDGFRCENNNFNGKYIKMSMISFVFSDALLWELITEVHLGHFHYPT